MNSLQISMTTMLSLRPARAGAGSSEWQALVEALELQGERCDDESGEVLHFAFPSTIAAFDTVLKLRANHRNFAAGISFADASDADATAALRERANALLALAGRDGIIVGAGVYEQIVDHSDCDFDAIGSTTAAGHKLLAYRVTEAGDGSLFRELVRRQVFRAAGAYTVGAWLLVQIASIVFPEFDAPRWAMRVLIVLLVAGFPLAVFLGWTLDITTSGLVRTPDSPYSRRGGLALRVGTVATAGVISAVVLWWVWTDYLEPTTRRPERAAIKTEQPVIAVSAPQKLAGDASIDWLGDGIANLLRNDLAESPQAIVLSQSRWAVVAADATDHDERVRRARRAGIDYLVGGEYLETPGGIMLTSWIEDLESGNVIPGSSISANSSEDMIAASIQLAQDIKRALRIPYRDSVNQYAADFAVDNMAAYQAYVAGLEFFSNFDYRQAEASIRAALALAPDYHMARFRLGVLLEATGRTEAARDMLAAIPDDANLTERQRLYIDGARASVMAARDPAAAIEIYRKLTERYPYDVEAGQLLADAYWLDFQEDAAIEVYRDLANTHAYDATSWMALGERLLDNGQIDDAEVAINRYHALAPEDHYAVALQGNVQQLRGNHAEAIAFYEQSLALKPGFPVAGLGLGRSRYLIGDFETAEELLRAVIASADEASRFRVDAAFDLAGMLRGAGRFAAAAELLESVESVVRNEGVYTAMLLSTLGTLRWEVGDLDGAAELIDASIAASPGVPSRYLFARGLLELHSDAYAQVAVTASEIQQLALPEDDPDRTEDLAAAYLLGRAALAQGDLAAADEQFAVIGSNEGYHYAVYAAATAELRLAQGALEEAALLAQQAMSTREPGDLRLDLEADRNRARLLYARILAAQGRQEAAAKAAREFLARWRTGSQTSEETELARTLTASD